MAEIGNDSVWKQADADNLTGTQPSWSGAASPSTIDDAGRAMMGAIKREHAWRNFTVTAGGTADAKTLTYSEAPAALYSGQVFGFIANTANTGSATLNINSLGAKTIKKVVAGTVSNLAAGDMPANTRVSVEYNLSNDYFVWINRCPVEPTVANTFAAVQTFTGNLIYGHTAAVATKLGGGTAATPGTQAHGTAVNGGSLGVFNWSSTSGHLAGLILSASKSNTVGNHTAVASGDNIGGVVFAGSDGTGFIPAAAITVSASANTGTNDMPGTISIGTTADGAATVTERAFIDHRGFINVNGGSFGRRTPVTRTNDFTVDTNENWLIVNNASSTTVTLPNPTNWSGREIMIKTIRASAVVSASSNVVPQTTATAGTAILPATDGAWATLVSDGTDWIIMQSSPIV